MKLLIANRGEIAIRVMRSAYELGLKTVAIYSDDDKNALHIRKADEAYALGSGGISAYLDMAKIIEIAQKSGCSLIHPGYGFLSENWFFAQLCERAGITFVGPKPATLKLFGNKIKGRAYAKSCAVPIVKGTTMATSLMEAKTFFNTLDKLPAVPPQIQLKAEGDVKKNS